MSHEKKTRIVFCFKCKGMVECVCINIYTCIYGICPRSSTAMSYRCANDHFVSEGFIYHPKGSTISKMAVDFQGKFFMKL